MTPQPKPFTQLSLLQQSFPDVAKLGEITAVIPDRDVIKHADLEDALRSIARRFERLPLKDRALDLYTNNRIQLLGNRETVKVPKILPAWRARTDRGIVVYVNATPYVPAAGASAMDVRRLFGLMCIGAVLVDTFDQWAKVTASGPLAKFGSAVYSRTMHKIADRIAGVGMDRMRSDQVKYVFAKYFLIGMMARPASETTDAIAFGCTAGSARGALVEFENACAAALGAADQDALYTAGWLQFVDALAKAAPWANRITSRGFLQTHVTMFDAFSLFGAEELGFFLAMCATHQAGAEFVPSFSFDPIYGMEGDSLVDEFARLVRR